MNHIRIVSHNAFWSQGFPFATDQPPAPDARILAGLSELYRGLEPDLLCLQEVQSPQAFRALAASLGWTGAYCPGGDLPQYGGATFWREAGEPAGSWSTCNADVQRMWQVTTIPVGATRLTVGSVHLPAGRQIGPDRAARKRLAELRDLVERHVPGLDLIVGDLNQEPGGDLTDYLIGRGYADAAVLAGQAEVPTGVYGARGDYIWVREILRDRVAGYGVLALEERREGKLLSDHFPLWVDLEMA